MFAHPFVSSRCQKITWKQNRQARRVTARGKRTVLCRLHPAPRRAPSPADAFCAKRSATGGLCKAPSLPGGLPRLPPESHQTKGPHLDALCCRVPLAGGGPSPRSWLSGFTWSSGSGVLAGKAGSFLRFLSLVSKLAAAAAPEPNPCACKREDLMGRMQAPWLCLWSSPQRKHLAALPLPVTVSEPDRYL